MDSGEDPQVRRPIANRAPAAPIGVAPFAFPALSGDGFEAYDEPRLLAAAFARHWGEALAIVSGHKSKRGEARRLATFVQDRDLTRACAILLEEGDDEARLVRLRLVLDPACEPVFRDVELSGDGLNRFAADAAADDSANAALAATCSALLDAGVLASHAAQPARRDWATVEARWMAIDTFVTAGLATLRNEAQLPALDAVAATSIRSR